MSELAPLVLTVAAKAEIAAGIVAFDLVAGDGAALPPFAPGAHVSVTTPGGHHRNYSLCDDPAQTTRWRIAVKREGEGSADLIDWVEPGDPLEVTRPANFFALAPGDDPVLLIAGGIGITPIRAMLFALAGTRRAHRLIYLTRSPDVTAFREDVTIGRFGPVTTLHHDGGDPARALDLAPLLAVPRGIVYCCGPRPLMQAVRRLADHWPPGSVRFEDFGSSAQQAGRINHPFRVRLASSGAVIDVPVETSLLDALRAHGLTMPSSCESGSCGTCRTGLIAGTPEHRDLVLSDAERGSAIMPCVSRAAGGELVLDL